MILINIFVNKENEKLYVETRVDARSQGSGEILLGEQVSDRSRIRKDKDRQELRNEVDNRMSQNKNAISQEGFVGETVKRPFGTKEAGAITTVNGKSVSIKGYPEELFDIKAMLREKTVSRSSPTHYKYSFFIS